MKKIASFVTAILFIFVFATPVFADNKVNSIDIEAVISQDGSLYIKQVWEGEFKEGTENYIPMNAPDFMTISDLKVTDENGEYQNIGDWNVDAGFDEKANKCGINYVDNGYEVCFGISEYGRKKYILEYKLQNVIGAYNDADGVNFRFVNDKMNTTPTDVTLKISLENGKKITDEICDIWAFGYDGKVEFSNGTIKAYTNSAIKSKNHVTIMMGFNKGVLSPTRVENESFEVVKNTAFEGSDYDTKGSENGDVAIFFVAAGLILAVIITVSIFAIIRNKKLKDFMKQSGYFRDLPNDGQINFTYALGKTFNICEENSIIGAGMLRLINLGCFDSVTEEKTGFMGGSKEIVSLRITGAPNDATNEFDNYLFTLLVGAAGEDGILQARELEKYIKHNDKLLRNYIDMCLANGNYQLQRDKCTVKALSWGNLKNLTEVGRKNLSEIYGFRQYLTDFSLIAERGIKELPIWREILSYAMLFGIADKLAKEMKDLYPEISEEIELYSGRIYMSYYYSNMIYRNMVAAEQSRRSSGSGGSASFGGGGGSFGGGSGGGSR